MLAPLLPPDGRALGNGRKENFRGKQGKFVTLSWGLVAACVFLGKYVLRVLRVDEHSVASSAESQK
jgi:hypothetical protein